LKKIESENQQGFFRLVRGVLRNRPEFKEIYSTPNGGKRSLVTASILKAEGARAGVWDCFDPFPIIIEGGAMLPGLYLEFKTPGEFLTDKQIEFGEALRPRNYVFSIVHTPAEAVEAVEMYTKKGVGNWQGEKTRPEWLAAMKQRGQI